MVDGMQAPRGRRLGSMDEPSGGAVPSRSTERRRAPGSSGVDGILDWISLVCIHSVLRKILSNEIVTLSKLIGFVNLLSHGSAIRRLSEVSGLQR